MIEEEILKMCKKGYGACYEYYPYQLAGSSPCNKCEKIKYHRSMSNIIDCQVKCDKYNEFRLNYKKYCGICEKRGLPFSYQNLN